MPQFVFGEAGSEDVLEGGGVVVKVAEHALAVEEAQQLA
jgi:hypothetical protein